MAKGIHVGDRFTCVGPDPVGASKAAVLEAISSHADRPICLTMTRPHDTSNGLYFYPINFKGPRLGLSFADDGIMISLFA